jgi:chromosome segregation ATPase
MQDESDLKRMFQEQLERVLRQKGELERRLEAESEFVSQTLRDRLAKLHIRTLQLRADLSEKSKRVSGALLNMKPDEVLERKIRSNHDQSVDLAHRIGEAHREIEGLTSKMQRLESIHENLVRRIDENDCVLTELRRGSRSRRFSK